MMADLGFTFNAHLYDINQAFERGDLGPLTEYLRSGTVDPDVLRWLADRIDPAITGGHKLALMGPRHRPRGGKATDRKIAVAETLHQLMTDPADQRTIEAKVRQVAAEFRISDSKVTKDYKIWKIAHVV
jgi:hypothetical protein